MHHKLRKKFHIFARVQKKHQDYEDYRGPFFRQQHKNIREAEAEIP